MVTEVPPTPIVGEMLLIVGAELAATVNDVLLVADPDGVVTAIVPVVAPEGTEVTISVVVEDVTVAAVPLNVTVFWLGVALKPIPKSFTDVPTGPLFGVNSRIATLPELFRVIERRLPTAS